MDPIEQFQRNADEAQELFYRGLQAFPVKRSEADLKARHEAGDRNVVKYDHGDGDISYKLEFTKDQHKELERAFLKVYPRRDEYWAGEDARVFVGVIEGWADSIVYEKVIQPEKQKERKRALESTAKAIEKLDEALSKLDSAALGYWYGNLADHLAVSGFQISETDGGVVSMLDNAFRTTVEAGEFRQKIRQIATVATKATRTAAEALPLSDHGENSFEFKNAKAIEEWLVRTGIPFTTTETGFAATALRALFGLAGIDTERVSYWLEKADEHPDSFGKFVERTRSKNEG